jgi:hypothetical protein
MVHGQKNIKLASEYSVKPVISKDEAVFSVHIILDD